MVTYMITYYYTQPTTKASKLQSLFTVMILYRIILYKASNALTIVHWLRLTCYILLVFSTP